jgi:hypothetical protein
MSEPLDLEALERRHANYTAHGVPRLSQDEFGALLARIRELEAERPDWSDEQIEDLCQRTMDMPHPSEVMRENLRAAGIVPNVARWRPISEAPKDGTRVLVIDAAHDAVPELAWWGAPGWGQLSACWLTYSHRSDFEDVAAPTHFQPLPAPPTTEAT